MIAILFLPCFLPSDHRLEKRREKMKKVISILSLIFLTSFSGETTHVNKSFNLIPMSAAGKTVAVDSGTGLSEDDFNQTIKHFLAINRPIAAQKGFSLSVKNKWTDETVNSDTYVSGTKWIVNAYGGLGRSDGMTTDANTLVLCHEFNHHVGGAPKYPAPENWASDEGESDYGAVMKCFRRMAAAGALARQDFNEVPQIISEKCKVQLTNAWDQSVCERSAIASLTLAEILRKLGDEPDAVSPNVQDSTRVSRTYDGHPNAQCRFDTMMAGSACGVPYNVDFSETDSRVGACNNGFGARPLCWYHPPAKLMMFTASI